MNVIKTIEVDGTNYQIAKMDAKTGSWLLMLLMGKLLKVFENTPTNTVEPQPELFTKSEEEKKKDQETAAKVSITMMLTGMDREEYGKVQVAALNCVYRLEGKGTQLPVPILRNGEFTDTNLEYDINAILSLTTQSLYLNIGPFFTAGKLLNL